MSMGQGNKEFESERSYYTHWERKVSDLEEEITASIRHELLALRV